MEAKRRPLVLGMIFAHRRVFLLDGILGFFEELARAAEPGTVAVAVCGNRVTEEVRKRVEGRVDAEYYSETARFRGGVDHDAEIHEAFLRAVERDFEPVWILHHNDDFVFEDGATEEIAALVADPDVDVVVAGNRLFVDWEHYSPEIYEPWDPVLWRWRPGAHFWRLSTSFLPVDIEQDAYRRGSVRRMQSKRLDFGFATQEAVEGERRITKALGRLDHSRDWVFRGPVARVRYEKELPRWLNGFRRSLSSVSTEE